MDTLMQDLRYGLRRLRKEPGVSALISVRPRAGDLHGET